MVGRRFVVPGLRRGGTAVGTRNRVPETVLVRAPINFRIIGDREEVCRGQTPGLGELQWWGAAIDGSPS